MIPLLVRDKQGRRVFGDEEEDDVRKSDEDEDANPDRYRTLPEWKPEFYPHETANENVAEVVTPTNQPDKMAEGAESKISQLSASCEPVGNSASQEEKSISFTLRNYNSWNNFDHFTGYADDLCALNIAVSIIALKSH